MTKPTEAARGWTITRTQRSARRDARMLIAGPMAPEHAERRRGWRAAGGVIELWFSSCNNEAHGLYSPSCQWCNLGEWVPTTATAADAIVPDHPTHASAALRR